MSADIRLLVVGEIRFYREGIARYLEEVEGVVVAGMAATADEAVQQLAALDPDVVLLDVLRPEGVDAVKLIRRASPDARVVAIGLPELERTILEYAEEGITGYVSRDGSLDELAEAIVHAARDELVCPPSLAATLMRHVGLLAAERRHEAVDAGLTSREREITGLIERGLSNKEIARELHIEVPTVKNHVHHILEKLRVSRRSQAAALYRRGAL